MEGKRKNINPGDLCGNDINRSQFRIFFIDILTIIPHTEFEATSRFISSVYMDLSDMEESARYSLSGCRSSTKPNRWKSLPFCRV